MTTAIKTITVTKCDSAVDTGEFTAAANNQPGGGEIFEAEISAADGKWFFEVDNTANTDKVTVFTPSKDRVKTYKENIGTVKANSRAVIYAESWECISDEGKVQIELRPDAGKNLSAGGVKVHAVQFLPVETK